MQISLPSHTSNTCDYNQLKTLINSDSVVTWLWDEEKLLCGIQIKNDIILGTAMDMETLKQALSKQVVQEGIRKFYKTLKVLGTGASSTVNLVRDRFDKLFAVKCMQKKETCRREIEIHRQLDHPNIVQLLEVYQTEQQYQLVLEYVPQTLRRVSREHDDLKDVLQQLLTGLNYLHSKNIVHRDLKLDNLMITEKRQLKIIDFGFATDRPDEIICGTPGYIAPEVLNHQDCTTKSDMFSVGCVMYRLYAGRQLFNGDTLQDVLEMNKDFQITNQKLPRIADQGTDLLQKLLHHEPNKRLSAQQALAHQYFTCQDECEVSTPPCLPQFVSPAKSTSTACSIKSDYVFGVESIELFQL